MERIVVDVITGEITTVPFTQEEIAEIQAQSAQQPQPASSPTLEELQAQLNAIQSQIQALSGGK
jgi:hypothetical protein